MATNIYTLSIIVAICITVGLVTHSILTEYLVEKNKLLEKSNKLRSEELFASIDIEALEESIEKYFRKYIDRYIIYNFRVAKVLHINSKDQDKMRRDLTKLITLEVSEYWIFRFKLVRQIQNTDDLITFIHDRVTEYSIVAVDTYNSQLMS